MEPVRSIEMLKNTTNYKSEINYLDLPKQMYGVIKIYAEEICPKRDECQKFGMIAACLRCFCDDVLEEDIIKAASGRSIVSWTVKRQVKEK